MDFDARFADAFPGVASPVDWKLYAALIDNDLPAWAGAIDPAVGKRLEEARGKAYQSQRLQAGLARNPQLRSAFAEQRKRIGATLLYAAAGSGANDSCPRSLIYLANEFRLILGESAERGDPMALATIAPGCPQTREAGLQITAGRSPRFRCWSGALENRCGWRLPIAEALKRVVNKPGTIKLRWRWRGLDGSVRVRYLDSNGNRAAADAIAVAVPVDLALEFVDSAPTLASLA